MERTGRPIEKACYTFIKNKDNIQKFNGVIKSYQIGFDPKGNMSLVQRGKVIKNITAVELENIVAHID